MLSLDNPLVFRESKVIFLAMVFLCHHVLCAKTLKSCNLCDSTKDINFKIRQVVNPFSNKHWFIHVFSRSLLKTLWEKEKLLFPTVFSTRLGDFQSFSSNLKLSYANSFNLEESQICQLGISQFSRGKPIQ